MKKTMFLSFFAAFLMTAFAFTPSNGTVSEANESALFSTCAGFVQASVQCVTEDPANPTITIRNKETGALAYTGPADGNAAAVTLAPGTYVVSVATPGHCQFTVKWDFCGDAFEGLVNVNNGSEFVGSITVC